MFKLKRLDDGYIILEHKEGYNHSRVLLSQSELIQLKEELIGMGF